MYAERCMTGNQVWSLYIEFVGASFIVVLPQFRRCAGLILIALSSVSFFVFWTDPPPQHQKGTQKILWLTRKQEEELGPSVKQANKSCESRHFSLHSRRESMPSPRGEGDKTPQETNFLYRIITVSNAGNELVWSPNKADDGLQTWG